MLGLSESIGHLRLHGNATVRHIFPIQLTVQCSSSVDVSGYEGEGSVALAYPIIPSNKG